MSIRSNVIDSDIDQNKSKKTSSQPISRVLLKSFIGGYFSLNSIFRPDIGVRGGYVECTDFDIHVPDLLLEFDEVSLKSLLFLVSVLSPSSSVSKSNSSSDVTAAGNLKAKGKGKGKRTERTQWETDLNIDLDEIPKATLRTLLWLERQSAHSERGAGVDAEARAGGEGEGEGADDDLDYDRLRDLMTKYLLSKKSLEEDAVITNTIREHSLRPLSNLPETLCDSDSGEDFPDDTHSDSDFADGEGEEGDGEGWEGEDGSDFQDAAEGKGWSMGQSSIRRVKMGQVCSDVIGDKKGGSEALQDRGRRKSTGGASRTGSNMDMSMSHSVYGAKSMATMDSGMFHSTVEGSSSTTINNGNLTGSTEFGFSRKVHKETRIRMHLAVVKVRLRDLAVLSNTHDHVSTDDTTDIIAKALPEVVPLSAVVPEEARECGEVQGGEEDKVEEGEVEKNTDAVSSIPTIPLTQTSLPPSIEHSRPGPARVIVRELILRMDSVIISTTLSHEGNGQRTSSDGACDCPEVSFSAGTVDASENTVSYPQDYSMQPIRNINLSPTVNDTAKDTQSTDYKDNNSSDCKSDGEAGHESSKNAEHLPSISAFPNCDTREENRIVLSSLSFLSFQTLVDEPGDGEDGVSGAQTSSRARTLISAPHVEGTFKFCPATHIPSACARTLNSNGSRIGTDTLPITTRSQPTIALDIRLEPLVLSVRHRTVHRWKSILDDVMGTLPPTKSHTKMTLQLNVPVVDLFIHCDPHFYTSINTCTSQYNVSNDGYKGSESSVGQGTGQGTGIGKEEGVISGIEELLAALNISPWSKLLTVYCSFLESSLLALQLHLHLAQPLPYPCIPVLL